MNIAGLPIGPDQPVRVVAELSNNHNGDIQLAMDWLEAVKETGADIVKFQCYQPDELVLLRGDGPAPEPWGSDGWTMRHLYEKAQTPLEWFPLLTGYCKGLDLPWFSSVFGTHSLDVLEWEDCPTYKLAALDHGKDELLEAVRATGKPLVRSCADWSPPCTDDAWLYCPPGYPQEPVPLGSMFRIYHGFSYHGTDPGVPLMAATLGASVIECHVQLDDVPSELEADVSLTVSQLADLVASIRRMEEWR